MNARELPGPALLFCPADRPDRYQKALRTADSVVLDLEDAVPFDRKEQARIDLRSVPLDPTRVVVRINAASAADHDADLAAVRETDYNILMLPKAESAEQVAALAQWRVIALCETPLGVLNAPEIAAQANVLALMWGAEDLIAAMNGRTSRFPDGRYRAVAQHARSAVLLAAAAHGRLAIDAVCVDIGDTDRLASEAEDAAASGFALKACIHPRQVPVVREAFQPTEAQVAWAGRVMALAQQGGVVVVDGKMIDGPLIRQAEAVLAAADRRLAP